MVILSSQNKITDFFILAWASPFNCHPLEVVGRGSETQLQVGENLNSVT